MIKGVYLDSTDKRFENILIIRKHIFKEKLSSDSIDSVAVHVLVSYENNFIAAGRLYKIDNEYYMDRIAVEVDYRNCNYGEFVVRMLLDKAFQSGADIVNVNSPIDKTKFFMRLGFSIRNNQKLNNKLIDMVIMKSNRCSCNH